SPHEPRSVDPSRIAFVSFGGSGEPGKTASENYAIAAYRSSMRRWRLGAIQRCAGYGKDSAKEGSPTMATTKLSDEALLAFFSKPSGASRQNGVDRRGG